MKNSADRGRCGNLNISLGKFCSCSDLSMPDKIYTYDNCLTLVFKSDGSNEGLGFLAEYTTTDNNVTIDPSNNCSCLVPPTEGPANTTGSTNITKTTEAPAKPTTGTKASAKPTAGTKKGLS
ncbi:unnamed protein product, partial [Porites evermanni]